MNQNINYDALKLADTLTFVASCIRQSIMLSDQTSCNDCVKKDCEFRPRIGQPVRINCPHWASADDQNIAQP